MSLKIGWAGLALVGGTLWAIIGSLGGRMVLADGTNITVTAVVAPTRIIVVSSGGVIQKIISNSTLSAAPTATTSTNRPLAITPALLQQYAQIAAHHQLNRVGVVYRAALPQPSTRRFIDFIAIVTNVYNYHLKL